MFRPVWECYEETLSQAGEIDFHDLINLASLGRQYLGLWPDNRRLPPRAVVGCEPEWASMADSWGARTGGSASTHAISSRSEPKAEDLRGVPGPHVPNLAERGQPGPWREIAPRDLVLAEGSGDRPRGAICEAIAGLDGFHSLMGRLFGPGRTVPIHGQCSWSAGEHREHIRRRDGSHDASGVVLGSEMHLLRPPLAGQTPTRDIAIGSQKSSSDCLPIVCQARKLGLFEREVSLTPFNLFKYLEVEGAQGLEPWTR